MKNFIVMTAMWLLAAAFMAVAEEATRELNLVDGSVIRGRVMSASASEVTLMTDFGVLRIALDKLTEASRQTLAGKVEAADTQALMARIAELEARVMQLQRENEALKKVVANPGSGSAASRVSGVQSLDSGAGSSASGASGGTMARGGHSVSSTGKRHNASCRFFGSGRPAGPTEGVACKICGG